jgi:glycosyltransferase involved in cell wall biosynthesis
MVAMTVSSPNPLVSVVVPAYNDAPILRQCMARLAAQTLAPAAYEIVVVDDGSTDDTPRVISEAASGRVRVRCVRFDRNRGRSAARNAAIRAAGAPLVVFVDSDVLVLPDFLQRHMEIHRSAASPVVGRGPVIVIPSPEIPARTPRIGISPAYLDTGNASVPRQVLVEAGLFDEGFRVYGWEDFDLGLRIKARGIPKVFSPSALAYHVQRPPTLESLDRHLAKEEERARTALYLLRKHPGAETRMLIQDTRPQRALHFLLGGAGLVSPAAALRLARWLRGRNLHTLAFLVTRGILNRHYLATLDRFRAVAEGR